MTEEIKLHTERLIIRTPWVKDAQDIFTFMKDKNTAMINRIHSPEQYQQSKR